MLAGKSVRVGVPKNGAGIALRMIKSIAAKPRFSLSLAFACFAVQGVANGMLGVAWPSIRQGFGLPLDMLATLLAMSTIGYVTGSVSAGMLMRHIGIGRSLMVGNIVAASGLLGYSLSPSWPTFVLFGILVGWSSGIVGASLNIFIAATKTVRTMNWMHAMYGIGATLGPLLMTAAITSQAGWRTGYLIAAVFHLALGLLFVLVLKGMDYRGTPGSYPLESDKPTRKATSLDALKMPIVWLGILLFLFYTGVETTTGQWTYSLFTEGRSMSAYLAGLSTSIYWAMLTVGRIIFGATANRIGTTRLLRWSMAGVIASAALFLIQTTAGGITSVALMGLSLSAIFPTLMSDTPNRVGQKHAASAIGLQTGAASIGLTILPGLAGILAARLGLEILGPFLIGAAVMMFLTNEISIMLARRNREVAEGAMLV